MATSSSEAQVYSSISTLAAYACCGRPTCCIPVGDRTLSEAVWGGVFVKPKSQVTSYFFAPKVVFASRLTSFLIATLVLAIDLSRSWEEGFWFAYLTNITYLGLWWYFLIATILSAKYHFTNDKKTFQRRPNWFEVFVSWSYTAQFTVHLFVPAIYWAYQKYTKFKQFSANDNVGKFTTLMMHGGDVLLFLIEMTMNKIIFVWGHGLIYIANLFVYFIWSLNTGKIWPNEGPNGDGYPYEFLNPNNPKMRTALAGVIVATIFTWVLAFVLNNIRARIGILCKDNKLDDEESNDGRPQMVQATHNI